MNSKDLNRGGSFASRLLKRLLPEIHNEPETKEQLVELLRQARHKALFDGDALSMMEGVLQVSDLQVRDIMIPRAQMVVVTRDDSLDQILPVVVESAHSRFPVIGGDRAEVVGSLLALSLIHI